MAKNRNRIRVLTQPYEGILGVKLEPQLTAAQEMVRPAPRARISMERRNDVQEAKYIGKLQATSNLQQALAASHVALEIYPNSLAVLHAAMHANMGNRNFESVETLCHRALKLYPRDKASIIVLGEVYIATKKPARAIKLIYDKFSIPFPEKILSLFSKVSRKASSEAFLVGKKDEAISYMETACKLAPQDALNWKMLGSIYIRLDLPENAEVAYTKSLSFAPKDPAALAGLANAEFAQQKYASAQRHLEQALAILPQDKKSWQLLKTLHTLQTEQPACGRGAVGTLHASLAGAAKPRPFVPEATSPD